MKKIHLIAAAAALLLSGGVFVKANQENNQLLIANLEALTYFCEQIQGPEYQGMQDGATLDTSRRYTVSTSLTINGGGGAGYGYGSIQYTSNPSKCYTETKTCVFSWWQSFMGHKCNGAETGVWFICND